MAAVLVAVAIIVGYLAVVCAVASVVRRRISTRSGFPADHRADRWDR